MIRPFKTLSLLTVLFSLMACQSPPKNQFTFPSKIDFQGKQYIQANISQIDGMQQRLYLTQASGENKENWQQGLLLFVDQNQPTKSLAERLALRQGIFKAQPDTKAELALVENELYSQVIYPPTARFHNIQLEVSRGRNSDCGFSQIQFSDKRSDFAKNWQKSTAYQQQLQQMASSLNQLPWLIECK